MTLSSATSSRDLPTTRAVNTFLIYENQKLGSGGEGRVFKAVNLDGRVAACKISTHYINESSDLKSNPKIYESDYVIRERRNLKAFGHLIDFHTELDSEDEDFIRNFTFMTLHEGIPLLEHLYDQETSTKRHLDILHITQLSIAVTEIMLNIHSKGFVIRDFKTNNFMILMDEKAADFTLAFVDYGSLVTNTEAETKKMRTLDGTSKGYLAPELDVEKKEIPPYTASHDYFSLGVILGELLTKENFQQNLDVAQTKMHFPRHLTTNEIKGAMSDVFVVPDLVAHRKLFPRTNEACTSQSSLKQSSRSLANDIEKKIRFHLIEMIYKLLAKPKGIPQTKSNEPIQIHSTTQCINEFIESRPTLEELEVQLTVLKNLRDQLQNTRLKRKKRHATDDAQVATSRKASTEEQHLSRGFSAFVISSPIDKPELYAISDFESEPEKSNCLKRTSTSHQLGLINDLNQLLDKLSLNGDEVLIDRDLLRAGQKARLAIFEQQLKGAKAQPAKATQFLQGATELLEQDPALLPVLEQYKTIRSKLS